MVLYLGPLADHISHSVKLRNGDDAELRAAVDVLLEVESSEYTIYTTERGATALVEAATKDATRDGPASTSASTT